MFFGMVSGTCNSTVALELDRLLLPHRVEVPSLYIGGPEVTIQQPMKSYTYRDPLRAGP